MKMKLSLTFYFSIYAMIFAFCINIIFCEENKNVYIVYMGSLPKDDEEYSPLSHHLSILQDILGDGFREDSLVTTYGRSFNGFAAWLSKEEKERMAAREDIMSIFPREMLPLQTTRSWDFMGFPLDVKRMSSIESDIIIGLIDSGIYPISESFSDNGLGPPPKKWKGSCDANFTCNNKIIGARGYSSENPIDMIGHGTHVASIAVGSVVTGANFYGLAVGTARGGVPSARVAVYKVCLTFCSMVDITKAFDDAIADGVDIILITIGRIPIRFDGDLIAIGSFHAMEKNVLTINAAGNSGTLKLTTGSTAPWMLSVGASTIDRNIKNKIVLGNKKSFSGRSVNAFTLKGRKHPLIYGHGVSKRCDMNQSMDCHFRCLDKSLVKDKIVLCRDKRGAEEATRARALGAIYTDNLSRDEALVEPLPAANLERKTFDEVISYINSTKDPYGYIATSKTLKDRSAPMADSYSSRGPNIIAEDILKPDISAPGTLIMGACSAFNSPSRVSYDKRRAKYTIESGTSIAAPHVAGAAAYVKSFHPNWSASAIKSALMTSASRMKDGAYESDYDDGEFAYGSGFLNPLKALEPGLVYETSSEDYHKLVCSMNITYFGRCPVGAIGASQRDLNYPSMQALIHTNGPFNVVFKRTVKNVGVATSTYKAKVKGVSGIKVVVKPRVLSFKALNQELSFMVTISGPPLKRLTRASASLVWSDGHHEVRSPIVVYTK